MGPGAYGDREAVTPPEAALYLELLTGRLSDVLGGAVSGVYIIGSLALGGFILGKSDIDVLAVSNKHLSDGNKEETVAALAHPDLPCPTRGLEFVLIDEETAAKPTRGAGFVINLNTGPDMAFSCSFDPGSEPPHWFVVDRSIARAHGIRLTGPPPKDMFAEIPTGWVLESLLESLEWHKQHKEAGANIVLNACRSWRWAEQGRWSSKEDAAAWAKGRGANACVIETAMARRTGGDLREAPEPEVERFLADVEGVILSALDGENAKRRRHPPGGPRGPHKPDNPNTGKAPETENPTSSGQSGIREGPR